MVHPSRPTSLQACQVLKTRPRKLFGPGAGAAASTTPGTGIRPRQPLAGAACGRTRPLRGAQGTVSRKYSSISWLLGATAALAWAARMRSFKSARKAYAGGEGGGGTSEKPAEGETEENPVTPKEHRKSIAGS
jgi:hypothetical protein